MGVEVVGEVKYCGGTKARKERVKGCSYAEVRYLAKRVWFRVFLLQRVGLIEEAGVSIALV